MERWGGFRWGIRLPGELMGWVRALALPLAPCPATE